MKNGTYYNVKVVEFFFFLNTQNAQHTVWTCTEKYICMHAREYSKTQTAPPPPTHTHYTGKKGSFVFHTHKTYL